MAAPRWIRSRALRTMRAAPRPLRGDAAGLGALGPWGAGTAYCSGACSGPSGSVAGTTSDTIWEPASCTMPHSINIEEDHLARHGRCKPALDQSLQPHRDTRFPEPHAAAAGDLGGLLSPSRKSTLLFQAGVSASLTPVAWSRLQVRGPAMATTLTPSQMAAHVDLSLDTLCYSERAGLMPRVQRLPNGHRRYGESDIEWLELVKCLWETGMPIRDIQRHPELTFTGDETIPERVVLLHEHRTNIVAQIAELQHNLEHLDWKLAYCADSFGVTAREATP